MIVYFHIVLLSTGMVCVTKSYLFQGLTYISWYKMLNAKQHDITQFIRPLWASNTFIAK